MDLVWIKSLVMFKVPGSINNCPVTFPYWSQTPQLWLPLRLLGTQAEEALLSPHFVLFSVGKISLGGKFSQRWPLAARGRDPCELYAGIVTPVSCTLFSVSPWPLWSFLPRVGLVPTVPPRAPSLRHCHRRLLSSESSHKMTKKPETSELIHSLL